MKHVYTGINVQADTSGKRKKKKGDTKEEQTRL